MKKHRSFKGIEKEEKKSKVGMFLAIFIAVIMIGGIGGIFLSNPGAKQDFSYEKYSFRSKGDLWVTKIDKQEKAFYFLPQEVDFLEVSSQASQLLKRSNGAIITSDPYLNTTGKLQAVAIFKAELTQTMFDKNKQVILASTKPINSSELPVITCENSTILFPVMYIDYGNETKIEAVNECIVVSAVNERTLIAILENLRYRLYGVIDEEER